ncbi:MAG TPA: hypothetical protein VHC97_19185 [Thermoanaerobaculia bacterium]|jgi:hypothetical protein|nr:hypothetical protein [Thermoanaerobaculia bacterium]
MKARSLIFLLTALFFATKVHAQPRAFFQLATPQGLNNQMGITRVPVVDASGAIKYYDVTLVFSVDNTGKLSLNSSATKIVASPNLAVGAFTPGIYEGGPSHCEHVVGAPGIVGNGRISGSIADDNCGLYSLRFNASWVSGSITGHPNEAALRAAGISFQGYSWGVLGTVGDDWIGLGWNAGDVIGVIQSGRQLTIHNFGNDSKEDTSTVFTLCSSCR